MCLHLLHQLHALLFHLLTQVYFTPAWEIWILLGGGGGRGRRRESRPASSLTLLISYHFYVGHVYIWLGSRFDYEIQHSGSPSPFQSPQKEIKLVSKVGLRGSGEQLKVTQLDSMQSKDLNPGLPHLQPNSSSTLTHKSNLSCHAFT